MKNSIKRIVALTKRNIKEILRDPLSLIFTIGLPLAMEILFYLIFSDLTPQFQMKYLAPAIVVFSQSFLALFVGLLLSFDRTTSFLTRLFVSKAKSYEFISSYAFCIIPVVLVQSILFFIVGIIFDSSIISIRIVYSILVSIITSVFYIAVGLMLGSICNEKSIGGVSSIVIAGQSVLSGMWFPIDGLKKGLVTFMDILPFRNATKLVQNSLMGFQDPLKDFVMPLLIVIGYSILVFAIAIIVFKSKMKEK